MNKQMMKAGKRGEIVIPAQSVFELNRRVLAKAMVEVGLMEDFDQKILDLKPKEFFVNCQLPKGQVTLNADKYALQVKIFDSFLKTVCYQLFSDMSDTTVDEVLFWSEPKDHTKLKKPDAKLRKLCIETYENTLNLYVPEEDELDVIVKQFTVKHNNMLTAERLSIGTYPNLDRFMRLYEDVSEDYEIPQDSEFKFKVFGPKGGRVVLPILSDLMDFVGFDVDDIKSQYDAIIVAIKNEIGLALEREDFQLMSKLSERLQQLIEARKELGAGIHVTKAVELLMNDSISLSYGDPIALRNRIDVIKKIMQEAGMVNDVTKPNVGIEDQTSTPRMFLGNSVKNPKGAADGW